MQTKSQFTSMFDLHTAIIAAGGPVEFLASIASETDEESCGTSRAVLAGEQESEVSVP